VTRSGFSNFNLHRADRRSANPLPRVLAGDLRTVSLSSRPLPAYVALSYPWGTDNPKEDITVSGVALRITRNLFEALQALVLEETATNPPKHMPDLQQFQNQYLWVDTLCINQDDKDEKSSQVRLMRHIYSQASKTLMWLGKVTGESDLALDWLMRITAIPGSDFAGLPKAVEYNLWNEQAWNGFCALLMRPYFRRRWIIEEAALSPDPWLVCGDKVLTWDRFYTGIDRCDGVLFELIYERRPGVMTTDVESACAIVILRYRLPRSINTTLFEMLTRFRRCDTVKLRDRVYALMGICDEDELRANQLNYRAGIEEIFIRQVLVHIKTFKNLDVPNACNEASRIERRHTSYEAPNGIWVYPDDPAWPRVTQLPKLPT